MQISKLMEVLNLGELAEKPTEVKGGLLHKMYCVTTSKGMFAVKVLNPEILKRPDALQNTVNSEKISAIFSKEIPVIAALEIHGKQIHELDGKYYMIFPWIEGQSIFPPDITEKHCEAIGDILGKMHHMNIALSEIEPECEETVMYEWDKYFHMAKNLIVQEREGLIQGGRCTQASDEHDVQDKIWLTRYEAAITDIKSWNQAACDAQAVLAKNMVISHRDLDPKNVMWQGTEPFIIDWEAAGYVNPWQELLEVINYWADDGKGSLHKAYFDTIIEVYEKHMNLTDIDWDKVFAGSYAGMLGWLEYNVKRSLGIEVASEEEIAKGEKQVVGTIKALYDYQAKVELLKAWLGYDR